jgi:transcriptional regulator with XRE-family HTH domain
MAAGHLPPTGGDSRGGLQTGLSAKPQGGGGGPVIPTSSATAAARIEAVERMRSAFNLSLEDLAGRAGVSRQWYSRLLVHPFRASETMLVRLEEAVRGAVGSIELAETRELERTRAAAAIYGGFLVAVCRELDVDPDQVRLQDPRRGATADVQWRRYARARQLAMYLANTVCDIPQRRIARIVNLTAAAVSLALGRVEDLREDPATDEMLSRVARQITGEDHA